ncbi:MAG: NAD-dependent epimerase/dehydratase family protein [Planctomycetaceae bacterium]
MTGGGGFLGLYIVEQLVSRGHEVKVFCRGQYPRLDELGVETIRGDIRNAFEIDRACRGVDVVFHTAALPGIWGAWKTFHGVNTLGTENVLTACHKHSISKLIYTSSPSVIYDGHPHEDADESLPYPPENSYLCHYPRSKAIAEKAVLAANGEHGLATVVLRPHLIWGPRDNHLIPRLIRRAKSGRLRRVGSGDNLISMTYVENAAQAHLQAAERLTCDAPHAGRAYFINEREPVNLWKWIDDLLTRAGLPPVPKEISAKAAKRIGGVLEVIYRVFRLPGEPPMTRFLASQLSSSHYYSIAAAERDFGFSPKVSVEEGMRRLEPELRQLARK